MSRSSRRDSVNPHWQKRRGVLFSPHRHPCSPLSFFKHNFQIPLWPSCPYSLHFSVGWSSPLLTKERAGKSLAWPIFSRNAVGLEQQQDHQPGPQPALHQPELALISSWGCWRPTSDGRRGRSRIISPTPPHSRPPMNTSQVLPRTPLSTHRYFCACSQPCLALLQRSVEKRQRGRERIYLFSSSRSLPTPFSSPRDHSGEEEENLKTKRSTPIYPDAFSDLHSSISLPPSSDS